MPRPEKTNIDWFPHPVAHGRKMGLLERKYGNNGYAVWFKILEELGSSENKCLSLRDEVQIELYASRCLVEPETLMQIVADLVRWEEFDRTLWETRRVLYSAKFIKSVAEVYRKRKTPPPSIADALAAFEPVGLEVRDQRSDGRTSAPDLRPPTFDLGHRPPAALPTIGSYEDLLRLPPLDAAAALTGDPSARARNTWKKYLRELSAEDPERGERMFREQLAVLHGEIKAGEIHHPAAMLTKRLKELTK